MSAGFETTERFLRPVDVGRVRRNHRRIQAQRILGIASRIVLAGAVVTLGFWLWRHTQSDTRFAVKQIEIAGATHTSRAELAAITAGYTGTNLFKMDIGRVQHDLRNLPWVSRIDIEKKLPDTLRIKITERSPVALVRTHDRISYVDEQGVAFADLSPAVGDDDLPLIVVDDPATPPAEVQRTVSFVHALRSSDPLLYSHISELRPIAPNGFALFDRELGTRVYANAADVSAKWRSLYSVVRAENLQRGSIEYADLRFADRVVVKPVHPITAAAPGSVHAVPSVAITN